MTTILRSARRIDASRDFPGACAYVAWKTAARLEIETLTFAYRTLPVIAVAIAAVLLSPVLFLMMLAGVCRTETYRSIFEENAP